MSHRQPIKTFVSSTDVVFSDDDPDETAVAPSPSTSTLTPNANSNLANAAIKGRNTAIIRPGARKSKTDALAAINARSNPSTSTARDENGHHSLNRDDSPPPPAPKNNPGRKSTKAARAPPLDFSTIRTSAPRYTPSRPIDEPERMFGLEHAPVYHPTILEFAKPLEYIEKIGLEAKEFGICKIVPPEGWRPPFALNTETFRFKTRLQQLNAMEASARASLNFAEQLFIYHRQQGNLAIAIPTINSKPLDMWKLKREVTALGGYLNVTNARKWNLVAKAMGYSLQGNATVCPLIKSAYLKIVVPFEDYVKRVKLAGGTPPPDPTVLNDSHPVHDNDVDKILLTPTGVSNGAESLATPKSDAGRETLVENGEKVRTASDKLNAALASDGVKQAASRKAAGLSPTREFKQIVDDTPGEVCEICTMDHDPDKIVLCDGCDRGYHLNCLSPPLLEVPVSQFFCDTCLLMNGADFGFEEGEDHSLHSFRRRADAFKSQWLREHPMRNEKGKGRESSPGQADSNDKLSEQVAIEDHFEREFWRLVESPHESVEIEYGADVNSTADGGGLPNLEIHPNDPYSRDGWNLNNLPILAGSLLRYIKSDISGMTIPWIYVGMVFSTFAWHKEDHYTYSINYHHWGDTKTWYGIPGADDEKLEAAMKLAAPELFDQQPDLMFQLVTLMSPGRLKKHGVRVVACDQRPNEFIVTFPRSYHSGFNHGFNFNEAVNFALPDWLPTGLQCVNRYRDIKKNPVFSHDELLVTISEHEKTPRNARWLLPNWQEMVEREMSSRKRIRSLRPDLKEVISASLEEEEYQCESCRTLCFLSQIVTADGKGIACLDHYDDLESEPSLFRLRYSDDELYSMLSKVKSRSDKAGKVGTSLISDDPCDLRTTGRKRKPSALALAAAGEDEAPAAQRVKREESSDSDMSDSEELDISIVPNHTTGLLPVSVPVPVPVPAPAPAPVPYMRTSQGGDEFQRADGMLFSYLRTLPPDDPILAGYPPLSPR